jgi:hypothetical protein
MRRLEKSKSALIVSVTQNYSLALKEDKLECQLVIKKGEPSINVYVYKSNASALRLTVFGHGHIKKNRRPASIRVLTLDSLTLGLDVYRIELRCERREAKFETMLRLCLVFSLRSRLER